MMKRILLFALLGLLSLHAEPVFNGDFSEGMKDWSLIVTKPASAIHEVVGDAFEGRPALKIEVQGGGDATNSVTLMKRNISVLEGKTYTLKFQARVEPADAKIYLGLQRSGGDYAGVARGGMVKISTDWQEISLDFSATATEQAASLVLGHLSQEGRTFYFTGFQFLEN